MNADLAQMGVRSDLPAPDGCRGTAHRSPNEHPGRGQVNARPRWGSAPQIRTGGGRYGGMSIDTKDRAVQALEVLRQALAEQAAALAADERRVDEALADYLDRAAA